MTAPFYFNPNDPDLQAILRQAVAQANATGAYPDLSSWGAPQVAPQAAPQVAPQAAPMAAPAGVMAQAPTFTPMLAPQQPMALPGPQAIPPPSLMGPAAPAPRGAGFFSRLTDGLMGIPSGANVTDDERRAMRSRSLMSAGLNLMSNSFGRPGQAAPSIGRNLPGAIAAGQAGAMGYLTQQDALTERATAQRNQEQLQTLLGGTGEMTPDSMRTAFTTMLRSGNVQGAKAVSDLLQSTYPEYHFMESDGVVRVMDKRTGQLVRSIGAGTADSDALTRQQQQGIFGVRSDLQQETRVNESAAQAYSTLSAALNRLLGPQANRASTAASALAVVYGYARLLDPGSVVREGELRLQLQAGSAPERLQNMWSQLVSGSASPGYLASIRQSADDAAGSYRTAFRGYVDSARAQLDAIGVDPTLLKKYDPWGAAASAPAGAGGALPPPPIPEFRRPR